MYDFRKIEKFWQQQWKDCHAYRVSNPSPGFTKPKYYVLDMFPYPSGAGLHVGHPLGYIASDIYARFKRLKGFNVLHPMGYDAFGLPAEQYAIEHGVHPAVSTVQNIDNFRKQLDNIGFCFDWDREIRTSDPQYYKWTQWIFLQLFKSWFNRTAQKAESIDQLIAIFEKDGTHSLKGYPSSIEFTADEWKSFDEKSRQNILMDYRLAFCGYGEVNWCEALGTVLANDEVVNGVSERGGYPVVKKKLRQWYLRITEYADRLLEGLERVDFSEAMKEMQTNWIGKSYGAEIDFALKTEQQSTKKMLRVYTTRPDTIFGVDFMVVAPELDWIPEIAGAAQKADVEAYISYVKSRSERERQAEKKISGCFTGAYAINPFNGREIPVWISEYVLAGYGTGAIMGVPCGDDRDFRFAHHFSIPITNIIGDFYNGQEANPTKDAKLNNSDFLDGIVMRDAIAIVNKKLEEMGIGTPRVNYRMRDAAFSRQRYWGEPFPIIWNDGIAYPLDESELPLILPEVDSYSPGPDGEGPLANIPEWYLTPGPSPRAERGAPVQQAAGGVRETNTMPGYAGSSWYFLRYMDPHNDETFCDRSISDYWNQVDLYIGGTEHAVGHLLYSRMWTKALYDLGHIGFDEPFKRLMNQGMITGKSYFFEYIDFVNDDKKLAIRMYAHRGKNNEFGSWSDPIYRNGLEFRYSGRQGDSRIANAHKFADGKDRLTESAIKEYINFYGLDKVNFSPDDFYWEKDLTEDGERYVQCWMIIEKMSKSKFNVDNPDEIVEKYGADTFRMYEMFLGPVEQSKPWDTKGIEGVHRFLRKLWRLFYDDEKGKVWKTDKATDAELKVLYRTIKKIDEDTERFSFNTGVSALMISVNELGDLKCHKKEVLEKLLIVLTPYAPHIAEELWHAIGNTYSILDASFPAVEEKYLVESTKNYPIAINGKTRAELTIGLDATQQEVEAIVLSDETVKKWLDGKSPKKIIYVKNKMINVVI